MTRIVMQPIRVKLSRIAHGLGRDGGRDERADDEGGHCRDGDEALGRGRLGRRVLDKRALLDGLRDRVVERHDEVGWCLRCVEVVRPRFAGGRDAAGSSAPSSGPRGTSQERWCSAGPRAVKRLELDRAKRLESEQKIARLKRIVHAGRGFGGGVLASVLSVSSPR